MSDNKDGKPSTKTRGTGETARRMLLAGIGAYGRAFMEAQEAIKDIRGKSSETFDELVQKGEMMEMMIEHKSKSVLDNVKESVKDTVKDTAMLPAKSAAQIDERIKNMRSRLMRGQDDDAAILARLNAVEAKLDKLLKAVEGNAAPAPKKASAKKRATKAAITTRTPKAKPKAS